jgi:lipid II:glycine glycyltransferase (peptidoglycan interpeptide bridge formation enzyme)
MYYLIKENSTLVGGLPAFVFKPIPGVKMLHSMPWNLFGGVQLIAGAEVDIKALIESTEKKLADTVHSQKICEAFFTLSPVQTVEYGHRLAEIGYQKHRTLFTHLLETSEDYEVLWNAYNKRVRGAVRKAAKAGVSVSDANTDAELEAFYRLYLATVKRLGGTPKPRSLIQFLYRSQIAKLVIAKRDGAVIAGLLYLHFNRTVTLWCEASDPKSLEHRPNNAIFHHIIHWACERGYECVDFGASPPEHHGLIAHKEQYRAQRFEFCSYIKIHSRWRRRVWRSAEPSLRKLYTCIQHARSVGKHKPA